MSSVNIFQQNGDVVKYRRVSERLPEFLEQYPIGSGYRLVSSHQEYLSATPQYSEIIKAAIEKGTSFETITSTISFNKVIFTCQLLDESNELVANASAVKGVSQYKDYEVGETAALQRLMAKLGFGGEIFDKDEDSDFESQHLHTDVQDKKPTSEPSPVSPISPAHVEEVPVKVDDIKANSKASNVPPALLRQLKMQAEIAGIDVPHVNTAAEAKAALKKIRSKM